MKGKTAVLLESKSNLTLSDLARLDANVKSLGVGYDNLQAMQKRMKISGSPTVVAQESVLISQLMKADAFSRFGQSQLDAKLSTACAYIASTLFNGKTDVGYEQGPFIPYYFESAALNHIQEHLAMSEYNVLAQIKDKQGITLNTENASKNLPIINLKEVRELLGKINSQTSEELHQLEAGVKGGSAVASLSAAQKKVDTFSKEIIRLIDKEIKEVTKQSNPILLCQRLRALSQEIVIIQKELPRYHIDVNEVVLEESMKSAQYEAKVKEFSTVKDEVLAKSELSENLKSLVINASPRESKSDDDFINGLQGHIDNMESKIANRNEKEQMQELIDVYKVAVNLRDSDDWKQMKEYMHQYPHDNSEASDKKYRTGIFNPQNTSVSGTLANSDHIDQIRGITTSAVKILEDQSEVSLSAESISYIRSECAADIEERGLSILLEHHKSKLLNQSREGWAAMQKNVNDLVGTVVSAIIQAAGNLPLTDVSDHELNEILDEKVKNFTRQLDPVVKKFIEVNGVSVLRDAIEKAQKVRDEKVKQQNKGDMTSANDKIEKIELLNGHIGRQIKNAWDNKNDAVIEDELQILSASVTAQRLSDPQRDIIATVIAEDVIQASRLTNKIQVAPNATLKIAMSREIANKAAQTTERVTHHMDSKSQAPTLPPMRDKSTVRLSTSENIGKKVLLKGPNMSWTKKATVGANHSKDGPKPEESVKKESGFRMK